MDSPEIDNRTEFVVHPHVLLERDGEKLVTLVKATYEEGATGMLQVAAVQRPLRFADEPWGDPLTTPPKYQSDVCGQKPGTDVIIVAKGYAPPGRPVTSFDVAARVGPLQKALRVFGLRVWTEDGAGLTAPLALSEEEIRYDHAFGGLDASDPGDVREEPRNPVGCGVTRDSKRLTHERAPSIEDPREPIRSARDKPAPAGLGAIGPHWAPRRHHAGTMDARWHREQAPLLPLDRDDRANLCASPGLTASPPLAGGEQVALMNLVPGGGLLQFVLPKLRLTIKQTAREQTLTHVPHLDTVLIDTLAPEAPSRVTVELVWRAIARAPRRMRDLRLRVRAEQVP